MNDDYEISRLIPTGSPPTKPPTHNAKLVEDEVKSPRLVFLILASIVISSSNQVTYKLLLNRFSSSDGSHNYEFFVSQWTTLLYLIPSILIVLYKYGVVLKKRKERTSYCDEVKTSQKTYFYMGGMDAASSTLGAIGGALTPGQLQTLLNQTIIPITIAISAFYLNQTFKPNQLIGATCIMGGSILASVPFLTGMSGERSSYISILIFTSSIIPSAMSNVYKESKMKARDLDVYLTTTMISVWQEILGFAFLPLLSLKAMGGMGKDEVWSQMTYGYACYNEIDSLPGDNCRGAFWLFWLYVIINWTLNVLLLMMTKEGSAVMLVVANAIALPVTNLAFSVEAIMGEEVEPFSAWDLVGLVLVIVGFLVYSSFGLAKRFNLAAGPPGQMSYHAVDGFAGGGIFLTAHNALQPKRLAWFLIALHGGSLVQGSVTAALELTEKAAMVLRGYKAPGGKKTEGPDDMMMSPRDSKGRIVGAGRVSPSEYEYGLGYGATEFKRNNSFTSLNRNQDSFF